MKMLERKKGKFLIRQFIQMYSCLEGQTSSALPGSQQSIPMDNRALGHFQDTGEKSVVPR